MMTGVYGRAKIIPDKLNEIEIKYSYDLLHTT